MTIFRTLPSLMMDNRRFRFYRLMLIKIILKFCNKTFEPFNHLKENLNLCRQVGMAGSDKIIKELNQCYRRVIQSKTKFVQTLSTKTARWKRGYCNKINSNSKSTWKVDFINYQDHNTVQLQRSFCKIMLHLYCLFYRSRDIHVYVLSVSQWHEDKPSLTAQYSKVWCQIYNCWWRYYCKN